MANKVVVEGGGYFQFYVCLEWRFCVPTRVWDNVQGVNLSIYHIDTCMSYFVQHMLDEWKWSLSDYKVNLYSLNWKQSHSRYVASSSTINIKFHE